MRGCFFIGHRDAGDQMLPSVVAAAERLILEEQVMDFYVGAYGGFDRLAGAAVIALKERYPNIRLYRVIVYHPAVRPVDAPPGYDGTFYPDGMENVSRRYAIIKANRKMVDACDFLIAYVTHSVSNAYNLLEYAERRQRQGKLRVVNLGKMIIPPET